MDRAIEAVRAHLRAGKNVCPYSSRARIHYVTDTDDFRPAFSRWAQHEAVVIAAGKLYAQLKDVELWARLCFLKGTVAAAQLSGIPLAEAVPVVIDHTLPELVGPKYHPQIALRGSPTVASCLAPIYREDHPRYSPVPIVLITWLVDVIPALGRLPEVYEAMKKSHGYVYDAMALVVPPP